MYKQPIRFQLTRYPAGSLRELWVVSWPMILSAMSGCLMTLVDRVIISKHFEKSLFALTAVQPWYWTIYFSLMAFFTITQVFVGHYNGAKKNIKAGSTAWSMLILSFALFGIILPLLPFINLLLAKNVEGSGTTYLQILCLFLPFSLGGFGVLGSFFIGRGKVYIIPIVFVCSNLLNIGLTYWFVCGGMGLPALGSNGAAYATGASQVFGFFHFLYFFLSKTNRKTCKTHKIYFNPKILLKCIKTGFPNATASFLNLSGFSLIYQLLALKVSVEHLTAYGMVHACYMLFFFIAEGISKGISSIVSNFLGAKEFLLIKKTFQCAIRLSLVLLVVTAFFMLFYPQLFLGIFFKIPSTSKLFFIQVKHLLFWAWILFFLETVWLILQGTLTAYEDTRFTMLVNVASFWIVAILPIYGFVFLFNWNSVFCWQIMCCDTSLRIFLFYNRYKQKIGLPKELTVTHKACLL